MPIAINITQIQEGSDGVEVFGTLTFSGNYVTGGDTLDFTTVIGSLASANGRVFTPSAVPVGGQINGSNGRTFAWILGTALNNQKVKIETGVDTELGAGAYPAGVTGDANIWFDFAFPKLL